jgi:hypothetical protein
MSALPPPPDPAPQTLAATTLPGRVRRVLEHLLAVASEDLEQHLTATLTDLEQQLFRLSQHARSPAQHAGSMQTLRTLRMNRSDLVPRFMAGLESSLSGLGPGSNNDSSLLPSFQHLSLVDESEMDEEGLLRDIAVRQESRASLTLHLLGQRFGVIAGAPAFDAERMPLGPRSLCRIMRESSQSLQLPLESRLLLYRTFDRHVMTAYPQMLEVLNAAVAAEGILPSLTFVPIRARATAQVGAQTGVESRRRGTQAEPSEQPRTHTAWLGEAEGESVSADEGAEYDLLQQLLSDRRQLIGKLRPNQHPDTRQPLATTDVVAALGGMRDTAAVSAARNLMDIKQALLAQLRQQSGHGASLSVEDGNTFELLDMLYGQIEREIRSDGPSAPLLRKLQLPLLRIALQDRGFFVRTQHPARQLLSTVAESGARWLDADDLDPQLLQPLQHAVTQVVDHYDGDSSVFEASNRELQAQMQSLARKAEMAERRHIEAARGKEKLEIARHQAADTIAGLVGTKKLPIFVRALLNQAWADVLTLTLLRQGQESDQWRRQLDATASIVETSDRNDGLPDPELANHIEASLGQVGYHAEEAAAIARRLTSALEDEDDPASRTELTLRLKARVRLGEDAVEANKPAAAPRTADEQAHYDRLRVMPYGTWIEFTNNQQGDVVRRRLSWYSPVTDKALFVNQRGQRVGEQTLDSLARLLACGQARVVIAERGRLIDRAWQATLNALRSFAGRRDAMRKEKEASMTDTDAGNDASGPRSADDGHEAATDPKATS